MIQSPARLRGRRGQALGEYVLVVALLGAGVIALLGLARGAVRDTYARSNSALARPADYGTPGSGSAGGWSSGGSGSPSLNTSHPGPSAPPDPSGPDSTGTTPQDSAGISPHPQT